MMRGCAWAGGGGDGCHFNTILVEIMERASGPQRPLQSACQGQTLLVLLSTLTRETERIPVNMEISLVISCLVSAVSHSERSSPIRVRTVLTTQAGEAKSCGLVLL